MGYQWGNEFTTCTWFKRTAADGRYQGIFSNGYNIRGSWEFRLGREAGGTSGGGGISGENNWRWFLKKEFALNQWHHVCMTYDAAHSNSAHFYHNGKDVGITGPASKPMKTGPNSVQIGF